MVISLAFFLKHNIIVLHSDELGDTLKGPLKFPTI